MNLLGFLQVCGTDLMQMIKIQDKEANRWKVIIISDKQYTKILELQNPLVSLYEEALEFWESDFSLEEKYDKIFSEDISKEVFRIAPYFSYYDPDSSYEEDILVFLRALNRYLYEKGYADLDYPSV